MPNRKLYQINVAPWFHEHLRVLARNLPVPVHRCISSFICGTLWDYANDPWLVLGDQPGMCRGQRRKVVMGLDHILEGLVGGYASYHRLSVPTFIRTVIVDAHDPGATHSLETRRRWFRAVSDIGFVLEPLPMHPPRIPRETELPVSSQRIETIHNIKETPNP